MVGNEKITPIRGLSPFSEQERDVFYGRDAEWEALSQMVLASSYRVGLLHGETGVGKTSLLLAGIVPHLRDHGIIAVVPDKQLGPLESFAKAFQSTVQIARQDAESAIDYLTRSVSHAGLNQYLFVVDNAGLVMEKANVQQLNEYCDIYVRIVTRSGGKARLLFCADNNRFSQLGRLESRTGSLFPPKCRYELHRMDGDVARNVFSQCLSFDGTQLPADLVDEVVGDVATVDGILPADLQIALRGIRTYGINTVALYRKVGGRQGIESKWFHQAAASTGKESAGLRLLGAIAKHGGAHCFSEEWMVKKAKSDAAYVQKAIPTFVDAGLVRISQAGDTFSISHPVLLSRIVNHTALSDNAIVSIERTIEEKKLTSQTLSITEYRQMKSLGLTSSDPKWNGLVQRTKKKWRICAGIVMAVPLLACIIAYVLLSGSYYLGVNGTVDEASGLVVKAGNPSLRWFHWLPSSPEFGSVVAKSGFHPSLIDTEQWSGVETGNYRGSLSKHEHAVDSFAVLRGNVRAIVQYLLDKNEDSWKEYTQNLSKQGSTADIAEFLYRLAPVATASKFELQLVTSQLKNTTPLVQSAALAVVIDGARRGVADYKALLSQIDSKDGLFSESEGKSKQRPLRSAVDLRQLAKLARETKATKTNILGETEEIEGEGIPSLDFLVGLLANPEVSNSVAMQSKSQIERWIHRDLVRSVKALFRLAQSDRAGKDAKQWAVTKLLIHADSSSLDSYTGDIMTLANSSDVEVANLWLPVVAKVTPKQTVAALALKLEQSRLSRSEKVALAKAWGQITKQTANTKNAAAAGALDLLMTDKSTAVKQAAMESFGWMGRAAVGDLVKYVKGGSRAVVESALVGLAHARIAGARSAVGHIAKSFRKKGWSRRASTTALAMIASHNPRSVGSYLTTAMRDPSGKVRSAAANGLCGGMVAGSSAYGGVIARAFSKQTLEIRRYLVQCAADSTIGKGPVAVANVAWQDQNSQIRKQAAAIFLQSVRGFQGDSKDSTKTVSKYASSKRMAATLLRLVGDVNSEVRTIAIVALGYMQDNLPKRSTRVLTARLRAGTSKERLAVMKTAKRLKLGKLVALANSDRSVAVRVSSLDLALETKTDVSKNLNLALLDSNVQVRKAALEMLSRRTEIGADTSMYQSIVPALKDSDRLVRQLALSSIVRLAPKDLAGEYLLAGVTSLSESSRVEAVIAANALADRAPELVIGMLEPLLQDASHDVRVALLGSLSSVYAKHRPSKHLAENLLQSEMRPMYRLVLLLSLVKQSQDGKKETEESIRSILQQVVETGPAFAAQFSKLAQRLIAINADAYSFLSNFVP